jgi:hypothetical protein
LYRKATALLETASRPAPELLASTLDSLADVCRKTDQGAEAERLAKQAREVRGPAE